MLSFTIAFIVLIATTTTEACSRYPYYYGGCSYCRRVRSISEEGQMNSDPPGSEAFLPQEEAIERPVDRMKT
ncbi:unnamed protein product [Haemonchus placei]|uniref:Uncharacterized protein n=1 Tax=Haemonchus placei TaxID=6290 RepID=A0A0N4W678_HAEPC|nr:unnamed protein product [Haemonchus placei]